MEYRIRFRCQSSGKNTHICQYRVDVGYRHFVFLRNGPDPSEQAISFVIDTGGKEEVIGRTRQASVAEGERPQAINGDGLTLVVLQLSEKATRGRSECVDAPIAEVSHQQSVAESAKAGRRQGQTPGRVQSAAGSETADEIAICAKNVDKPDAGAGHVVMTLGILHGKGDKQLTADVANAKRSESGAGGVGRDAGISK